MCCLALEVLEYLKLMLALQACKVSQPATMYEIADP